MKKVEDKKIKLMKKHLAIEEKKMMDKEVNQEGKHTSSFSINTLAIIIGIAFLAHALSYACMYHKETPHCHSINITVTVNVTVTVIVNVTLTVNVNVTVNVTVTINVTVVINVTVIINVTVQCYFIVNVSATVTVNINVTVMANVTCLCQCHYHNHYHYK